MRLIWLAQFFYTKSSILPNPPAPLDQRILTTNLRVYLNPNFRESELLQQHYRDFSRPAYFPHPFSSFSVIT